MVEAQHADMLKAYIIKSRVKDTSKLLIAQPYSPRLFRQGVAPGPNLLMQVLQGVMSAKEARKAWKTEEQPKADRESTGESWMKSMELPCRKCTEANDGVEVCKPVSAFTASHDTSKIWKDVLAHGQDLCCVKCEHRLPWSKVSDAVVPCDSCGQLRARNKFGAQSLRLWESLSQEPLYCLSRQGLKRKALNDSELIFCNGECQRELPEYHFVEAMIVDWRAQQSLLSAKCARCIVRAKKVDETTRFVCQTCGEEKHISCFSSVELKEWLTGQSTSKRWSCYDCQYPPCCLCAGEEARPLHAIKHNALLDGKYYCFDHRYPPCTFCGRRRVNPGSNHRFRAYTCSECQVSRAPKVPVRQLPRAVRHPHRQGRHILQRGLPVSALRCRWLQYTPVATLERDL